MQLVCDLLRPRSALPFLVSLASFACQLAPSPTAREGTTSTVADVINGDDDRRELYEVDSADERAVLTRSVAALMWAHRIDYAKPTELRTISAGAALGLCADERFASQPAAAFCSATLVDDDLVLTAGHCLGDDEQQAAERCKRLVIVFDYHYSAPGELSLASADDIYACRRVAYHEHTHTAQRGAENFADIAFLQLDRKVSTDRRRVTLGADLPIAGEPLVAASHGVGLPLKIDLGGAVVEAPPGLDYLVASTDSFAGGSGGPLFSEAMSLLAYQVRGEQDWALGGECLRPSRSAQPMEQHQLARRAVQALCATQWPSEALCGRPSTCGDGICTGSETNEDCTADCTGPRCGDGVCEPSERMDCGTDCNTYPEVPAQWLDDPGSFHPAQPEPSSQLKASGGCNLSTTTMAHSWSSFAPLALVVALLLRRIGTEPGRIPRLPRAQRSSTSSRERKQAPTGRRFRSHYSLIQLTAKARRYSRARYLTMKR